MNVCVSYIFGQISTLAHVFTPFLSMQQINSHIWSPRPRLKIFNVNRELFIKSNAPCLGEQAALLSDCVEEWTKEGHRPPIVKRKSNNSNISTTIDNILNETSDFSYSTTNQPQEELF